MRKIRFQLRVLQILTLVGITLLSASVCLATESDNLTVFAAASTTNAVNDIAAAFKKQEGIGVTPSYASSSTLAKQIEQGAPASVFISADQDWMNYLAKKELIVPSSRYDLLGNKLVLIAPVSSKIDKIGDIKSQLMSELGPNGRLATGDPDHVPVGKYTKAALEKLGIWKEVEPKIARAGDVRGALALVERAEVPLGSVYSTDAAISKNVKIVGFFPPDSYPPVVYPAALIKANVNPNAEKFFKFIKGPEAKAIFEKYGFSVK